MFPKKQIDWRLCLITGPTNKRPLLEVVATALKNGVGAVQYRNPEAKGAQLIEQAQELKAICRAYDRPFLINDRVDVALAVSSDGVHLGQEDMPASTARALLGRQAIIGLSITDIAQLSTAPLGCVDYLGVGPVFATTSKPDAAPAMGTRALEDIVRISPVPVMAIGGIDASNVAFVMKTRVTGVCVISAICQADDPEEATRSLL